MEIRSNLDVHRYDTLGAVSRGRSAHWLLVGLALCVLVGKGAEGAGGGGHVVAEVNVGR